MAENTRSKIITQGVQRIPNRAMLRAVGFGDGDFEKPIVGVVNAHSTVTPRNANLDTLARRAEAALRTSGVMPQVFGTITSGVLAKYARLVSSSSLGAVTDL